jgi:peptide/nickel transport system permease protein
VLVALVALAALFGPLVWGTSPYDVDLAHQLEAPSRAHWFGTDMMGRDLFIRVIYAARLSLSVGLSVGILAGGIGLGIGLLALQSATLDLLLMSIADTIRAVPTLLLAIALMAVLGGGLGNVILSLVVVCTPALGRLARSTALVVREAPFVAAMRARGAGPLRILLRQVLPNILRPLVVRVLFVFATAIVTEASLSVLGAGIMPPVPSWGSILSEGRSVIYQAPWMILYPGLATVTSILGLHLLAEGLRERFCLGSHE